jgi:large subunit ribosomal protein L1
MIKMTKRGKKYLLSKKKLTAENKVDFTEAIKLSLEASYAKFDETVDLAVRLGVDPRHADQMVRGRADFVGNDELIEKVKGGWFEFDKAVSTPDMMGAVGKIGKVLGPRGLMPNAKTGTVTFDVAKAVQELKAGKIDFRVEKAGIVHAPMGKVSFGVEKIVENITAFIETIVRLKPASSKGTYLKGIAVSTTMGPGIKVDTTFVKDLLK